MSNRVLFAGCSFSEDCGFLPENQKKYHWTNLLQHQFGFDYNNIAIGGMSNPEIFYRTVNQLSISKYDIAIIQWSGINRFWAYNSKNNIDDVTMLTNGIVKGYVVDKKASEKFARLYYEHFFNTFVELKHWLLNIIALQSLLESTKTNYLFVKGFDNFITELLASKYMEYPAIPESMKSFFDFDNRSDDYLHLKLTELTTLIDVVKTFKWVNFESTPFSKYNWVGGKVTDFADDGMHPGIESNKKLAADIAPLLFQYTK